MSVDREKGKFREREDITGEFACEVVQLGNSYNVRIPPETYLEELRGRIISTLKNPNLSQTAAEEVKAALILLRENRRRL